jgi:hypothetical protein
MTDQFPDATQMVLSPAAQAVASAYDNTPEKDTGNHRYLWLAAALRAAADEVAPETPDSQPGDPLMLMGIWSERRTIRHELLFIAAELEAQ